MAEGLLKQMLIEKKRNNILVRSAGVSAGNGLPASVNAVAAMAEQGIDITSHRSQPLTGSLIAEAELILVMELYHKDYIERMFLKAAGKIKLLKEFGIHADTNPDVQDPMGGSIAAYRYSAEEINRCLVDFVAEYLEERN
jgi:protein-tyrosine-phosphatase